MVDFFSSVMHYVLEAAKNDQVRLSDEIRFIESFGNYLKINCVNHRYVVRETLAGFYRKLPPERFLRVHRSFIVALARVDHFTGHTLQIGDTTIPTGNLYKPLLREALGV